MTFTRESFELVMFWRDQPAEDPKEPEGMWPMGFGPPPLPLERWFTYD